MGREEVALRHLHLCDAARHAGPATVERGSAGAQIEPARGAEAGGPPVTIVLGVYNGAAYLHAFMESLLAQDYAGWRLLVRDDASTDETPAMLASWQRRLGDRIAFASDSGSVNLGLTGNFARLLVEAGGPYVMTADCDDVWLPDKISRSMAAMLRAEKQRPGKPILVHTDLAVVDEALAPISPSAWKFYAIDPHRAAGDFGRQVVQATAFAPTLLLNRALLERVGEIPAHLPQQDTWISMVASTFGHIEIERKVTVLYRRHGSNDSAGVLRGVRAEVTRALRALPRMHAHLHDLLTNEHPRNRAFLERFETALSPRQRAAIAAFLELRARNPLARRIALFRYGLWFTSATRNVGMFILI